MDKKSVFRFLRAYTTDPLLINRLFVSAFFSSNNLTSPSSGFLNSYLINAEGAEYSKLLEFQRLTGAIDLEHLTELFEFVVSPEDKIVNGAVYTPKLIRDFIVSNAFRKKEVKYDSKIADIACGCGSFLLSSAERLHLIFGKPYRKIFEENIYGLDIQEYSIERTKILLYLLAVVYNEPVEDLQFNLFHNNALSFDWNALPGLNNGFDFILGNPPYVCSRNMDAETKALALSFEVAQSGHPDLYIPFFEIGIKYLDQGGLLGFITVNSFFKSVNGRSLRAYFQRNSYDLDIIDFGGEQVFSDRSTYTCLCFIAKVERTFLNYTSLFTSSLVDLPKIPYTAIDWCSLNAKEGWILRDFDFIRSIEQTGTPFHLKYKTRNGIATLRNDVYIFTPGSEDENYYYIDEDLPVPIEKAICVDIINSNKLIQNSSTNSVAQKIIFPYQFIGNNNRPSLLTEDHFRHRFPNAYHYLLSKKSLLDERDGGKGEYQEWFAFGRNQSLDKIKYKLFFPHLSSGTPNVLLNDDENLLFYNGLAAISEDPDDLIILSRIIKSDLFWRYIVSASKPYSSGFFSLSRNYIKNIGIPNFTEEERIILLTNEQDEVINELLCKKYKLPALVNTL